MRHLERSIFSGHSLTHTSVYRRASLWALTQTCGCTVWVEHWHDFSLHCTQEQCTTHSHTELPSSTVRTLEIIRLKEEYQK